MNEYGIREQQLDTYRKVSCPEGEYVHTSQRIVNQGWLLQERIINIHDHSLSDEHSESGNLSDDTQTGEDEVDDSRYEHGRCRAVRESFPPVKFRGSGVVKK